MRWKADQVSAYGQEPWARQALAALRRGWPDWAFLVVGYQWLALRGKQVMISATGPQALRHALPPIPAQPVFEPGSQLSGLAEHGLHGVCPLARLAELFNGAPGVISAKASVPPLLASESAPDAGAGAASVGGGGAAGMSGPWTADAGPLGVAAERSVTGTWSVAGADGARVAWRQGGWWPWALGRRRDRARPDSRTGAPARPDCQVEAEEGHRRRRRRGRSRSSELAGGIAA